METPETQGVPIDQRCWDCGYDLRGLADVEACPECGADRGAEIDRRRARFVRMSLPWVALSVGGTLVWCVALGTVFASAGANAARAMPWSWILVLASLPLVNLLVGSAFLARCERGLRPAAGVILVRAGAWANVSFGLGAMVVFVTWAAMIPILIAGCVTIVSCIVFIVRWGVLGDRAYLPARGNLGGVQGATVATIFMTGMWPAWFVVFWRVFG